MLSRRRPDRSFALSLLVLALLLRSALARAEETGAKSEEEPRPMEDVYTLAETVVSTTKAETDLYLVPQHVSIVSEKRIEQRIPSTTPDLFDRLSGILVQKTNWGGGSVFIRGLTGKHILILVDGVRLNNSLYRSGPHQYLNTLDPNIIERIEVVRGPMSVLYGSDALGGTINIITKKRKDTGQDVAGNVEGFGKYGSAAQEGAGRLQLEGNAKRFTGLAGATYRHFGDVTGGGDIGVQVPTGYDEVDADAKFAVPLAPEQEIVLSTQFSRQYDVPKTSEVTLGDKLRFDYEPQLRFLQYVQYEGRDVAGRWLDLARVNVSFNRQTEGEDVIPGPRPVEETLEENGADTLGALVHLRSRPLDWISVSGGTEFYQDWIHSSKDKILFDTGQVEPVRSAFPDGSIYQQLGVYLQAETYIGNRILLLLGGRYSYVNTSGALEDPDGGDPVPLALETDNLSGSAQLRVEILPWLCAVGGVAQGFRAPNMEDFFGKVDFTQEIPNTELKPERSLNFEGGLKGQNDWFQANVFGFYSEYEDLIDRVEVGETPSGDPVYQRRNVARSHMEGVEVDFLLRLPLDVSVWGAYSWMEGTNTDTGDPLRRVPPMMGSLTVHYEPGDRWWAEVYGRFAGEQSRLAEGDKKDPRIPEGGTPGYAVFGLMGGARIVKGLAATLVIDNLGNVEYKTHGSGIYGPGTNVMVGLRYRFP